MNEVSGTPANGMLAALDVADSEDYLGDPSVVDGLLRNYANTCIQRRAASDDAHAAAAQDVADALTIAQALLGESEDYTPMPNWNKAGVIDRWLKDEFNALGETPERIVQGVIVTFLMKMFDVMRAIENQPDDMAQMTVDGLVQEFTGLLIGLPDWNKE